MNKTVLVIGSGGREHALAWKLAQSPHVKKVYIAPGNPGTALVGENIPVVADNFTELLHFVREKKIDLTVVGPDDPLAAGIVDLFQKEGLRVFGPTQLQAKIEWSKAYAKELMDRYHLPTARFATFHTQEQARAYLETHSYPLVIKASGLALGKGVFICRNKQETDEALLACEKLGEAGRELIIEEYLEGPEVSVHALSDGKNYVLFPFAQDHKRIGEGNTGANTGGMGTYAPLTWVMVEETQQIKSGVIAPVFSALQQEPGFSGCLFPGLILTSEGPKILEFNARFGDPETQSYMRLLHTDLYELLSSVVDGHLKDIKVEWKEGYAVCVIAAAQGYPGKYEKGEEITGLAEAEKVPGVVVFQAGTAIKEGKLVTNGGRVLGVSAVGDTLEEALKRVYEAMSKISFAGMQFRRDIARQGVNKAISKKSRL